MENLFVTYNRFAPDPVFMDPIDVVKDPYAPDPLPPVYLPPEPYPVKDPYNPIDPTVDPQGAFRAYHYSGVVRGAYTELPLPGATVSLVKDNAIVARQAADGSGRFAIDIIDPVDYITITETSHKPFTWPASEVQHTFDLEPNEVILPPVILPPGTTKKDNTWLLWLGGAFVLAKSQKWI